MDFSLFLFHYPLGVLWLLIYVDDITITGNNTQLLDRFVAKLDKAFSLKDLVFLHYILGIEVHCTNMGMHLSQMAYINELL